MRSPALVVVLLSLLACVFLFAVNIQQVTAGIIIVPDDYPSIHEAIGAAESGDTILVGPGVYVEHLVVDKSLTIIGESRDTTVIDGSGAEQTIIDVIASNVAINSLTVKNSSRVVSSSWAGIKMSASGCTVTNTYISNCKIGILVSSGNCELIENILVANGNGIALYSVSGVTIEGNNATANTVNISVAFSSDNTIRGNLIMNSSSGGHGIHLSSSSNNTVADNDLVGNYHGMWLSNSSNNQVFNNRISKNVLLGLELAGSSDNKFYHNSITYNPTQVRVDTGSPNESICPWDNSCEGNYWSDYDGNDTDGNGIRDTPYTIDINNADNYPLMGMFSDFAATSEHNVQTVCNSSISDFQYNNTAISFKVSGENNATGFCRICIPTGLINSTYEVYVNGTKVPCNLLSSSNITHSYLYFTYNLSTKEIIVIPEFPSWISILLLLIVPIAAITFFKRGYSKQLSSEHNC